MIINDIEKTAHIYPETKVIKQLEQWCKSVVIRHQLPARFSISSVSGDASFRAYYRLHFADTSLIAVTAPPSTEKNHEFVAIANGLNSAGLIVPTVLEVDYEQGFLLLTDLGDQLLLPLLNASSVTDYYCAAIDAVIKLQAIPEKALQLPPYNEAALQIELDLFLKWFLQDLLAYSPSHDELQLIQSNNALLIESATQEQQRLVHRDYHARNIMCVGSSLAMIDFQDALWGPVSYDVVSLLKDCYVKWPRAQVLQCLNYYHQQASQNMVLPSFEAFTLQFDLMGMQRHLKVLGVFARLSLRDGKPAYLNDLPRVMAYISEAAALHKQTREFGEWFDQVIYPLAKQQTWFTEAEQ